MRIMTKLTKYVGVNTSLLGPIVITEHNGRQNELDVDIVCVEKLYTSFGLWYEILDTYLPLRCHLVIYCLTFNVLSICNNKLFLNHQETSKRFGKEMVTYVIIRWPWDLEGQVKGKDLVHVITRVTLYARRLGYLLPGTVCDL